ncbi:MAG: hypothetical protein ACOCV1_08720 [Bacillota bacterium]
MYKRIFLILIIILLITTPISATSWKAVNYSNPDLIKDSGLTVEEFNSLTQSEWLELFNGKEKVNFAFSATDSNGEDITNDINPDLSIIINGNNDSKNVSFAKIKIPADQPPSGEKIDSLNDRDEDGYLDIWYLEQLANVKVNSTEYKYELMRDLDFNDNNSYLSPENNKDNWTTGEGWVPINDFKSELLGNGYSIFNLYINRPNSDGQALFKIIINSKARVENFKLLNVNVTGKNNVGGLAGTFKGVGFHIKNIYVSGQVTSSGANSGLLAGENDNKNKIYNSYTEGLVKGNSRTGGLIGDNNDSYIYNSYSTATVTGNTNVGGLLGYYYFGAVKNSFWDKEISGVTSSAKGTGLTTSEMKTAQTFIDAGWDTDIWELKDGQYPKLKWE